MCQSNEVGFADTIFDYFSVVAEHSNCVKMFTIRNTEDGVCVFVCIQMPFNVIQVVGINLIIFVYNLTKWELCSIC